MKNNEQSAENKYLMVTENIRLRPASLEDVEIALPWYQDMEILKYTAGVERTTPYDQNSVKNMYRYLMKIGECYIIEIKEEIQWLAIGDVTLSKETIPIVIGRKEYWGRGIAKKVLSCLIERAKEKRYTKIKVKEIYDYNSRSMMLFKSLGFKESGKTENGIEMELELSA